MVRQAPLARVAVDLLSVDVTTALRWALLTQRDWSTYISARTPDAASRRQHQITR